MADPPTFTDTDPDSVESTILTDYESRSGDTLQDGNPVRLILEAVAYGLALQRAEIQDAAEQNLIQYATGPALDALGRLYALTRKLPQKATTILEFRTDGTPAGSDITIPQGTRVATESGEVEFATDVETTLKSGDTSVTVDATAETAGADANGLVVGQVSQIVNPIAGIAEASNTEKTSGGSDTEPDDVFRDRILKQPETFSVAGPRQAYEAIAQATVPETEVSVTTPSPGQVDVYVLKQNGDFTTSTDKDDIFIALSDEEARPLTDTVTVKDPGTISYDIDMTYTIFESEEGEKTRIDSDVTDAVDAYIDWQRRTIGRDVNPDELRRRVLAIDGIKRITVTSPPDKVVDETEVARLGTRSVSFNAFEVE